MTETNYIRNYEINHSRFGGKIYPSDFETDYPITICDIASRIISDRRFDEQCKKAAENRDRKKFFQKGNE